MKLRNAKLLPFRGVSEFYYAVTHFDLRKGQTVAPNTVLLSLPPLSLSISTSLWSSLQVFEKTIASETLAVSLLRCCSGSGTKSWQWCDTRKTAHQLPESLCVSDLHATPASVGASVLVMLTLHRSTALGDSPVSQTALQRLHRGPTS